MFYFISFSTTIIISIFLYNLVMPRCVHMDLTLYCVARYISSCLPGKSMLSHLTCLRRSHVPFQTCSAFFILIYLNSKIRILPYAWNIFFLISVCLDLSCHFPLCLSEMLLIKRNLKQLPCCSDTAFYVSDLQSISIFG